ncbi:MAG: DUF1844 domain-containing protein [Candidatus Eisenbacteria bacterium]|nr:DUF1844 domain-containing protein [Candidatus Eisenbacteria bacterium]
MTDEQKRATGLDGRFFRLVATFEAAAMHQLGKIAHPVTGEIEVDLEGARDAIDMLAMVSEKTEGNLNEDESRLLEHILYQLRLNFVDVAEGGEASPKAGEVAGASESGSDEGGESAAASDEEPDAGGEEGAR